MGYNGLIDPKSGFSPACCYSGPVQCPAGASVAYKFSITAATVYKGITGFIDCRAARARRLREDARPRPLQALARGQWRRPPAVPAPPQPADAEARREARSTRQCPTVTTKAVEDLEDRSPKFPPNLNRSPKCSSGNSWTKASEEARSANGCPKCASKPEALVEVGIVDVDATVDCKCQEDN